MENLYRTWTEFNKIQNKVLNGPQFPSLLKTIEANADTWKTTPYPKTEAWRYVKFGELPTTHFHLPLQDLPNRQVADQDFYSFEISNFKIPQKFSGLSLPKGMDIVSEVENSVPRMNTSNRENPFASVAKAFYGLGFSIEFSSSFKEQKPIRLVIDLDQLEGKDFFIQQNITVRLAKSVKAEILLDVKAERFSGLCNLSVQVEAGSFSHLNWLNKEKGGPQSHFIYNFKAELAEEAHLHHFDLTLPSRWSRHNLDVSLEAKNSECQLRGIYLNNDNNFVDHHTSIEHKVGDTRSFEDYRGILTDSAQAVFNGKIIIAEGAKGSSSEQINKNLMLSRIAEVDTKPELQIHNDDVKAAHGATVGQIDEEQRFYLQSRGYSKKQAGRVLSRAFVLGLLEEGQPPGRDLITKEITSVLEKLEENL